MHRFRHQANAGDGRAVLVTSTSHRALSRDHQAGEPGERERIEALGAFVEDGRVFGLEPSRGFGDLPLLLCRLRWDVVVRAHTHTHTHIPS